MAIPNARASPPPPLPPPRHIHDLNNGHDLSWQWSGAVNGTPSSVKSGSSLLGGSQVKSEKLGEGGENIGLDGRRGSMTSMITPSESDLAGEAMDLSDEDRNGARRPSLANYR